MIFDTRKCELGEGPLWHPKRGQLFWFDILNKKLLTQANGAAQEWQFNEMCSAAGWVSENELLIASETQLFLFNLDSGAQRPIAPLEADNPITRSNDGRADPHGGFWIGTMGKRAETGAGAIYRYYRGQVRRLYGGITISNAICFAPNGKTAYFTDTVTAKVMRVALDGEGWPLGEPQVYLNLQTNPDGAVIDSAGNMWLAEWGSSRVGCYDPSGALIGQAEFYAPNTSCPAFGGPDLTTLYCTTALQDMDDAARASYPKAGMVFAAIGAGQGQAEHQVMV